MAETYINPQEVLDSVGGPPQSKPSPGTVTQFIVEAESIVRGTIGELPETRDEEVAGIIRDIAGARTIILMRGAQSSEPPRAAMWLAEDARKRLADYDARHYTRGGVKEVDEEAFINFEQGFLFTPEDAYLTWSDQRGRY